MRGIGRGPAILASLGAAKSMPDSHRLKPHDSWLDTSAFQAIPMSETFRNSCCDQSSSKQCSVETSWKGAPWSHVVSPIRKPFKYYVSDCVPQLFRRGPPSSGAPADYRIGWCLSTCKYHIVLRVFTESLAWFCFRLWLRSGAWGTTRDRCGVPVRMASET